VTYEELAALAAGDLDPARADEVIAHAAACERCSRRLAALRRADGVLASLPRLAPPAPAVLAAGRALAEATCGGPQPEIMTLDETAAFLRISADELGEIIEELPAFELAGRIRVRRSRLIEWIARREAAYARDAAASRVARVTADRFEEGVA
jgi:hypothetical protein